MVKMLPQFVLGMRGHLITQSKSLSPGPITSLTVLFHHRMCPWWLKSSCRFTPYLEESHKWWLTAQHLFSWLYSLGFSRRSWGTYEYLPILLTAAITTAMRMTIANSAPITMPATWPDVRPSAGQKVESLDFEVTTLHVACRQVDPMPSIYEGDQ